MPKLAAKPSEDEAEANAPTEVREVPTITRKQSGDLTPDDLAEAASFADVVVQSVMARASGSRPASGVVPSNKAEPVRVPGAPRMPRLDTRAAGRQELLMYAIVAGAVVGLLAWCALRYL